MLVKLFFFNIARNYGIYLLFQLFAIVTCLDFVKSSSCAKDITFIRDDVFSNLRMTRGRITTYVGVENAAKCSVRCDRHADCKSFFFSKKVGRCQINSMIYLSRDGSISTEGFVYYMKEMVCPVPPSVPNSQPQFDVNSPPNAAESILEYKCNAGYTAEGKVRCQVDGTWTQMSCTKDCPRPPAVPNSNQLFDVSTASKSQGTSLHYECQTGFVPENDLETITCQASATWTSIVCKRPDCPSPPVFANSNEKFVRSTVSTVYGATVRFECTSGFVAENDVTTITCGVDATWTSIGCKRPDCPIPTAVANSHQLFDPSAVSTAYGETLRYECKSGFVPKNGVTSITCDIDAKWTSSVVCKRPDCPSPPIFANSYQQFNPSLVSTAYGETLKYGCNSGFLAENGVTTITCDIDATWTSNVVCKRPDCPNPPVFADSYQQFNPSSVSTAYGETLKYGCNSGFVAENGVTTIRCGVDATWTSIVCKQHPGNPFFVGLSDLRKANSWEWTDWTAVEYKRWKPNEPSNYKNEDCLKFNYGFPGWNDELCERERDYICETFL